MEYHSLWMTFGSQWMNLCSLWMSFGLLWTKQEKEGFRGLEAWLSILPL
jgi:hypothetical protein